jgi:hypothetical protein
MQHILQYRKTYT